MLERLRGAITNTNHEKRNSFTFLWGLSLSLTHSPIPVTFANNLRWGARRLGNGARARSMGGGFLYVAELQRDERRKRSTSTTRPIENEHDSSSCVFLMCEKERSNVKENDVVLLLYRISLPTLSRSLACEVRTFWFSKIQMEERQLALYSLSL